MTGQSIVSSASITTGLTITTTGTLTITTTACTSAYSSIVTPTINDNIQY